MTTNVEVLCGTCKCAVETVANPKSDDNVTCPRCNRSDRFDNVMASVKEYAVYCMHSSLAKSMPKSRPGDFIQITMDKPRNRSFRWITSDMGI